MYFSGINHTQNAVRPLSAAISTPFSYKTGTLTLLTSILTSPQLPVTSIRPSYSEVWVNLGSHISAILLFNKEETFARSPDKGFSSGATGWNRLKTCVLTKSSVWRVQFLSEAAPPEVMTPV